MPSDPRRGQSVAEAAAVGLHEPGLAVQSRHRAVVGRAGSLELVVSQERRHALEVVARRARADLHAVARRGLLAAGHDLLCRRGRAVVEDDLLVPGAAGLLDRHRVIGVVRVGRKGVRAREAHDHDGCRADRDYPSVLLDLVHGTCSSRIGWLVGFLPADRRGGEKNADTNF